MQTHEIYNIVRLLIYVNLGTIEVFWDHNGIYHMTKFIDEQFADIAANGYTNKIVSEYINKRVKGEI